MNKITNLIIFAAGAAVGSAVTWKIVKTKYEQIAKEEIDSVKEAFSKKESISKEPTEDKEKSVDEIHSRLEKPNLMEYAAKVSECGYSEDLEEKNKEEDVESMDDDRPYVISPDEFGELDDYDLISLTYYADEVLADDIDEIVEDVDNVVGLDSLTHFGEYEPDSVFVRNDRLKADYEILLDERTYPEAIQGAVMINGYPQIVEE